MTELQHVLVINKMLLCVGVDVAIILGEGKVQRCSFEGTAQATDLKYSFCTFLQIV